MRRTAENAQAVGREIKRLRAIAVLNDSEITELSKEALKRFADPNSLRLTIDTVVSEWDHVPRPYELGELSRQYRYRSNGVGCNKCEGVGFIVRTDRRRTLDGVRDAEVAYYCECHPGGR